jgi:hypothetical protein
MSNRRLEFQLCTGFVGPRGFGLVGSTARPMERGLSPFGRADLHPRRNPLDRQYGLVPEPDSDGQLAQVVAPASGQIGLGFWASRPAPAPGSNSKTAVTLKRVQASVDYAQVLRREEPVWAAE